MPDKTPEIYSSYKEAAEAVRSGDEKKIQDLQRTFSNLTPEDQDKVQALIDEVIDSAEAPTKGALASLKKTMAIYEGIDFLGEKSLTKAGVPLEKAHDLGRATISPFTVKCIKEYQKRQNIDSDGVIGIETYSEMLAGKVLERLNKEMEKGSSISKETIRDIKFVWKHGKKSSINTTALFARITILQTNEKVYAANKGFLDKILGEYKAYSESEEGKKAAKIAENTKTSNGKTLYENIKEGNFEEIIKNPTLLFTAGILFLFGVIGGDTKYTDSFFKRIGWIIGGLVMGPKVYNELVGPALADAKGALTRTPEAQTAILEGRDKAENIFESAWDWGTEKWEDVKEWLMPQYDDFTKKFESKNQTEKTAGPNGTPSDKYIEKYSEKHGIIFSDEKFLRAPIDTFASLSKDKSGLAQVLSNESYTKLVSEYNLSDKDAKNFIDMYILSAIKEAKNERKTLEVWGDIYMSDRVQSTLQDAVENVTEWLALPFFMTASLDSKIKTELSTLLFTGSPAQQETAKNLGYKLSIGKFDEFKLDNFPELTGTEADKFISLMADISNILVQENIVKNYIYVVKNISIPNYEHVSQDVIRNRWEQLQSQKKGYNTKRPGIIDVGVTTESLDVTIAAKEIEILKSAQAAGISTLSGVNVAAKITETKQAETIAEQVTHFQGYLEKLDGLPSEDSTPLDLQKWYEANQEYFSHANGVSFKDATNLEEGSNEKIIADAANKILKRKEDFISLYETIKKDYSNKFITLEGEISSFDTANITANNLEDKHKDFQQLSKKYSDLMSDIKPNWVKTVSTKLSKNISDWLNDRYSLNEKDIFETLNSDLGITTANPNYEEVEKNLKEKAGEIKKVVEEIIIERLKQYKAKDIFPKGHLSSLVDFVNKYNKYELIGSKLGYNLETDSVTLETLFKVLQDLATQNNLGKEKDVSGNIMHGGADVTIGTHPAEVQEVKSEATKTLNTIVNSLGGEIPETISRYMNIGASNISDFIKRLLP